jgi:hypothetical protein
MKRTVFLFLVLSFTFSLTSFSQESIEKTYATFGEFLDEQTQNISSIENHLTIEEVKEIIGPSVTVNIPKVGEMEPLSQVFKQPEFTNEFKQNPEKLVFVLWYFSTPKDQNGVVSKNECTPILFENGKVKGKGWAFYTSYRRTNRLMR